MSFSLALQCKKCVLFLLIVCLSTITCEADWVFGDEVKCVHRP
jgi:hypothetical protein